MNDGISAAHYIASGSTPAPSTTETIHARLACRGSSFSSEPRSYTIGVLWSWPKWRTYMRCCSRLSARMSVRPTGPWHESFGSDSRIERRTSYSSTCSSSAFTTTITATTAAVWATKLQGHTDCAAAVEIALFGR